MLASGSLLCRKLPGLPPTPSPSVSSPNVLPAVMLTTHFTVPPACRLDQAFIFVVSVLIAFGLSWHVYSSWVGIAINTGAAALVAALGVREVRGLQPHYQRHRWVIKDVLMMLWGTESGWRPQGSLSLPSGQLAVVCMAHLCCAEST